MKTRIIVGAVLAALLIALLAFGGYVLLAALTLFTLATMYEMALLFRKKGIFPIMLPVYLFAATFCFVYYFWGKEALFLAYALFATAIMIWSVCSAKHTMTDAVATLFLLLYPGIPMLCLLLVYMSFPRETALNAACLAYAAPELCDLLLFLGWCML